VPYVSTPSFETDDAEAEAGVAFGEGAMAGAAAVALWVPLVHPCA
jgi:hypothetical protein